METVSVKNMVCDRCVMVVKQQVERLDLSLQKVTLGEVIFLQEITAAQKALLRDTLTPFGFEVIDDEKTRIAESIKHKIIYLVHSRESMMSNNLSNMLSLELNNSYSYLAGVFSEVTGSTIQKYYIAQKIERVKELLDYDELTLSEIADRLNYSSVAYLSNQFKKITGFSPSTYKQLKNGKRISLDKL
ncbi:helix-turn-helix domain-containing protein [Chitinophaga qingshengii]|uniref:Helix-turn-helix transcriptional regulator n=1 Tax=Chitinophaga qingshengii TaxID=1569794 RepID=A0ABR7TQX0_9BACT|nr:AraC family transcriptional regulator [Chitinophaga qingshengii]MBC9931993.1 helix-turn-helix transcriptional regulator [Chitinophaga qingshengii]